jgi:hypothetical protein
MKAMIKASNKQTKSRDANPVAATMDREKPFGQRMVRREESPRDAGPDDENRLRPHSPWHESQVAWLLLSPDRKATSSISSSAMGVMFGCHEDE